MMMTRSRRPRVRYRAKQTSFGHLRPIHGATNSDSEWTSKAGSPELDEQGHVPANLDVPIKEVWIMKKVGIFAETLRVCEKVKSKASESSLVRVINNMWETIVDDSPETQYPKPSAGVDLQGSLYVL